MANDLIVIEGKKLTDYFLDSEEKTADQKVDELISEIQKFARSLITGDPKTKEGAAEYRSTAASVASTKVALVKAGKALNEEAKKLIDANNARTNRIEKALDDLKVEVRKPLTDFETAEKARTDKHEADISVIAGCLMIPAGMTSDQMQARIDQLEELSAKEWEEFNDRAMALIAEKVPQLKAHREQLKKNEEIAAENARLKAESDALKAAETKRQQEADQAKRDAELLQEAEWREYALVAGGWDDAIKIAAKSKKDEENRQAALKKKQEDDEIKRQQDFEHTTKIKNEAVDDIMRHGGVFIEHATEILKAIAEGKIRHVTIKF